MADLSEAVALLEKDAAIHGNTPVANATRAALTALQDYEEALRRITEHRVGEPGHHATPYGQLKEIAFAALPPERKSKHG